MDSEKDLERMEETASIQKAIEKIADDETANLSELISSPVVQAAALGTETAGSSGENASLETSAPDTAPAAAASAPGASPAAEAPVHRWFFTFMCMNLPIIGWFYLLGLAFGKSQTDRRNFARAYLFYKLVFLLASALIIGILVYIGLDLLDQLLAYMEML